MRRITLVSLLFIGFCHIAILASVSACPQTEVFDSYGDIPWSDEKLHLDNFAIQLSREPTMLAYLVFQAGSRKELDKLEKRVAKSVAYLVSRHKIKRETIKVIKINRPGYFNVILQPIPKNEKPPKFGS